MPELPEVETVRRGLERVLVGRRIRAVHLARADLRWPIPCDRVAALVGRRCTAVRRRAKYLLVECDGAGAPVLLLHLGMSGRLFVGRERRAPRWRPHEHWRIRFDGAWLRCVDPRRFGVLDVIGRARVGEHRLLRALGLEPFDPGFDGAWLFARTRRRCASTKAFLMDAREVVGVGNIYASEACFRAGVRPGRAAGRLTRADADRLADAVRETLDDAIRAGGTTLRDYAGAGEESGWFQRELRVYGRAGEPCPVCRAPIRRSVHHARATYWCARCQR